MNRAVVPQSPGQHFVPLFDAASDFQPVFGRAILNSPANPPNFRALKGPAAITEGAPRPFLYHTAINPHPSPDALPDWTAIYLGGGGFETSLGTSPTSWRIAARPVLAGSEKCVACHGGPARLLPHRQWAAFSTHCVGPHDATLEVV